MPIPGYLVPARAPININSTWYQYFNLVSTFHSVVSICVLSSRNLNIFVTETIPPPSLYRTKNGCRPESIKLVIACFILFLVSRFEPVQNRSIAFAGFKAYRFRGLSWRFDPTNTIHHKSTPTFAFSVQNASEVVKYTIKHNGQSTTYSTSCTYTRSIMLF